MANASPKPGPGRPKGSRNKVTMEIKALAEVHAEMAIGELARLAQSAESEAARVAAIKELLDRGFGKSPQSLLHQGDPDKPLLHEIRPTLVRPRNPDG